MSIRGRATLGAVALCLGLLMVVGGSVSKSSEVLKYQRDLEKGKPNLVPPDPSAANIVMAAGWIAAAGGAVLVVLALRDMTRQIGDLQSGAEARMRLEIAEKKAPGRIENKE